MKKNYLITYVVGEKSFSLIRPFLSLEDARSFINSQLSPTLKHGSHVYEPIWVPLSESYAVSIVPTAISYTEIVEHNGV